MKNFIQPGNTLTVTAPSGGVASGDPVLVGALFGVAASDAAEGSPVEVDVVGVFDLPKATSESWAVGDSLYWDAANEELTKTAGDNLRVATATAVAGSSATIGSARIGASLVALSGLVAPLSAITDMTAITGGETPTEAEHNAVITKINAILAAMRSANVIAG